MKKQKNRQYFLYLFFIFLPLSFSFAQQLDIKGANKRDSFIIDSITFNKNHKNIKSIINEVKNFNEILVENGFFDCFHTPVKKINDSLYSSTFDLGIKYKEIILKKDKRLNPDIISYFSKKETDSTFTIIPKDISEFCNSLVSDFENNGNPFAEVQIVNLIKKSNKTINAEVKLTVNEKRKIDKIIVKGYEKFPKAYLKHYAKLQTGNLFNKEQIINQTKDINTLSFARTLKDSELLFTKDSTTLYIYLEKVKSNYFDGFLGFNSDEDTGNLKLNGYVDLKLNNNLNTGEQLNILWKNDGNEQTKFIADLDLPFLFNSPVGLNANLDIFKKDSSFVTINTSFKASYQINHSNRVLAGILQTESNDLLENNTNPSLNNYNSTFISGEYIYTKRNSFLNIFPTKINFRSQGLIGSRKDDFGKQEQTKFLVNANYLWKLNNRNYFYINNTSEALFSDNYLDNEKLRLGGILSVRGFNENSIEATLYSTLNTEYRYLLSKNSYFHTIIDFSYIQDSLLDTETKLYGFGFGLGIRSKAGLMNINYAVGKTDNTTIKLSESKVHISFSTFF